MNLTICSIALMFFKKRMNENTRKRLESNYQNLSTLARTNYESLSRIANLLRLLLTINFNIKVCKFKNLSEIKVFSKALLV